MNPTARWLQEASPGETVSQQQANPTLKNPNKGKRKRKRKREKEKDQQTQC